MNHVYCNVFEENLVLRFPKIFWSETLQSQAFQGFGIGGGTAPFTILDVEVVKEITHVPLRGRIVMSIRIILP